MIQIIKPTVAHAQLLSEISIASFLPAHGHSAPKKDIDEYVQLNFNEDNYKKELENIENHYHLFYADEQIAGYSKVLFNEKCPEISDRNISYLSRIYFLPEFYGKGFAHQLLAFNINLCKENNQKGIWLKVWVKNDRAINFYKNQGFNIIGKSNFRISDTHSNPNHHMYLEL